MGSNLNFKNSVDDPSAGAGGRPPGDLLLTRQPSVYSLTFDEFQTTVGGAGKDFGSMNMDELLKSIWSAEDNHNLGSASAAGVGGPQGGTGYLQKQGSMILPRTLSQKTVDEVWKDMSKEYDGGGGGEKDSNGHVSGGFGVPHRQPTLGEITLEEFLVRAGVVREELNTNNNNNVGLFGDLWHPVTSTNTNVGFGGVPEFSNPISANLPLNVNGVRAGAAENHQFQQQQQQQQILPKPPVSVYGSQIGMRGGMGISNQTMSTHSNGSIAQSAGIQGGGLGMVGLGGNNNNGIGVRTGSPAANYSSDGLTKSNGDTSPVSPMPYVFNGGVRGRRSAAVEKVVERRQRRMIKNRESAAKSRARKQAHTTELEEEVAKLKEEHEELLKKQAEILEMQKNQVLEMIKQQNGDKRQCLRRTQTGPW